MYNKSEMISELIFFLTHSHHNCHIEKITSFTTHSILRLKGNKYCVYKNKKRFESKNHAVYKGIIVDHLHITHVYIKCGMDLDHEIKILKTIQDNQVIDCFIDDNNGVIITKECKIAMVDYMMKHSFNMSCIQHIMLDVVDRLIELRQYGVHHLDIKPDNICFTSINKKNICLIDYGAAQFDNEQGFREISKHYSPPEVLEYVFQKAHPKSFIDIILFQLIFRRFPYMLQNDTFYYEKIDVWQTGVVLFQLMFRYYPFIFKKGKCDLWKTVETSMKAFPAIFKTIFVPVSIRPNLSQLKQLIHSNLNS